MYVPTPTLTTHTCSPGSPHAHIPGYLSVLGALELQVDQAGPKRYKWPMGPAGETVRVVEKTKFRQGKTRGQAAGTHRFTRPAHTFWPRLSFGARLPRQSRHVHRCPLQAGAGSAAITLVRDGHSQELRAKAGSQARRRHQKGSLCAPLRALPLHLPHLSLGDQNSP